MPLGAERAVLLGSGSNTYDIEILIVAGGAGGGGFRAGGGGAGGVIYDADYSIAPTIVYDINVGGSGNGGVSGVNGTDGNDSVWNVNAEGGGITFTADGGGKGAGVGGNAYDGGSGGGGKYSVAAGGSATQTSPTGATGYGNVASDGTNGGYYAGGGGGGGFNITCSPIAGPAGVGGGGIGAAYNPDSDSAVGMANTGGGGGGRAHDGTDGSSGGSGIIIIRYSGDQVGTGGTVTSSGGYTYHKFTSSGTYTG